jgi:hypothetical protein
MRSWILLSVFIFVDILTIFALPKEKNKSPTMINNRDLREGQVKIEKKSEVNLKAENEELNVEKRTKHLDDDKELQESETEARTTVDCLKRSMTTDILIIFLLKFFIVIGIIKIFKKSQENS